MTTLPTPAVTNLKATPSSTGAVNLTWTVSNTNYLTGFDLLVKNSNGTLLQRIPLPAAARSATVQSLTSSTLYAFNVRCVVEVGGVQVTATTVASSGSTLPQTLPFELG